MDFHQTERTIGETAGGYEAGMKTSRRPRPRPYLWTASAGRVPVFLCRSERLYGPPRGLPGHPHGQLAARQPRPTKGILVAMTVRNSTLASSGRLAMYSTALA